MSKFIDNIEVSDECYYKHLLLLSKEENKKLKAKIKYLTKIPLYKQCLALETENNKLKEINIELVHIFAKFCFEFEKIKQKYKENNI